MKFFGVIVAVSLGLSSCGEKKKDYSGFIGSCTYTAAEIGNMCVEYSYSAKDQKEDPLSKVQGRAQSGCSEIQGAWSTTATCKTADLIGSCTIDAPGEEATVTSKVSYYTGGVMTAELAQTNCNDSGGTFVAN
jgi:hypothetical protein